MYSYTYSYKYEMKSYTYKHTYTPVPLAEDPDISSQHMFNCFSINSCAVEQDRNVSNSWSIGMTVSRLVALKA
jgi:hypothetical protein